MLSSQSRPFRPHLSQWFQSRAPQGGQALGSPSLTVLCLAVHCVSRHCTQVPLHPRACPPEMPGFSEHPQATVGTSQLLCVR